jgi:hypothetical protein
MAKSNKQRCKEYRRRKKEREKQESKSNVWTPWKIREWNKVQVEIWSEREDRLEALGSWYFLPEATPELVAESRKARAQDKAERAARDRYLDAIHQHIARENAAMEAARDERIVERDRADKERAKYQKIFAFEEDEGE